MDQSLEVTNIKIEPTESTSNDRLEISNEMQLENIKQKSYCLDPPEIYIKTEAHEDENDFPVIASTSYGMCSNYNMRIKTEESLIKIKCEDQQRETIQDPLDIGSEIKDVHHFRIDLESMPRIKIDPTYGEKNENRLETDMVNSNGNGSNQGQDQLLGSNNPGQNSDKKYICSACNKAFKLKGTLVRHLLTHTGEKPFMCEFCEKSFTQKGHLNTHILIHSGEKPHVCDVCNKVFSQKSTLNGHKLIHSGKKPFSCTVCNKSFAQKHHLVAHMRIHTGDKPYVCHVCCKTFVQKQHLNEHSRTHTGEKPYSCVICAKSFSFKSTLNNHKKKIHKN